MQPSPEKRHSGAKRDNPKGARRVVISLDDTALSDPKTWKAVVEQLKQEGLNVHKEMNTIGIVAGSVSETQLPKLGGIKHVISVEDDERRTTQ